MSAPEFQLQKSICQTLAVAYPQVLVMAIPNGAALCATNDPEGRKRAQREISKLKVSGMLPGAPDLMVFWPAGGVGAIEVKSPVGRLSPDQCEVHRWLEFHGHRAAVVRSLGELHATLFEWGVPSRISVSA